MAGPIYTRKGDKGKTSLFDGKKVWKFDRKVEAYGTIDELNSVLGAASAFVSSRLIITEIEKIQNDLLEIGSSLAVTHTLPLDQLENRPEEFEKLIDKLTKEMPTLNQFILPGGSRGSGLLHVARSVSRRAERKIVQLSQKETIDGLILTYLNRLSDLLFTFARYENFKTKRREKIWRKR
jgi:cob(I)alamin adenosyltransferase